MTVLTRLVLGLGLADAGVVLGGEAAQRGDQFPAVQGDVAVEIEAAHQEAGDAHRVIVHHRIGDLLGGAHQRGRQHRRREADRRLGDPGPQPLVEQVHAARDRLQLLSARTALGGGQLGVEAHAGAQRLVTAGDLALLFERGFAQRLDDIGGGLPRGVLGLADDHAHRSLDADRAAGAPQASRICATVPAIWSSGLRPPMA
ncbi:hypothetical protein ACFSLT_27065 [Novosphingobium resinovorum]